jgi:hypothetical protein
MPEFNPGTNALVIDTKRIRYQCTSAESRLKVSAYKALRFFVLPPKKSCETEPRNAQILC